MSRAGTAFCMANTTVCMHKPSPAPNRNMKMSTSTVLDVSETRCRSNAAMTIVPVPTMGKIL